MAVSVKGPPVVLDGPPPVAPAYSLLSVPGVLQDSADGHWLNGAFILGYPSIDDLELWEGCSEGTARTKGSGSGLPQDLFGPFGIYVTANCTARGMNWEDLEMRAERTLTATQSFAVEKALSQGITGSSNPFFGDGSVATPAGNTAQSPDIGLAYLEEAIGETGRQGLIHATPGVASRWGFSKLETDGSAETADGTPVAIGGGYVGGKANGNAAAAGSAWAYATGPVRVYLSSLQSGNSAAAVVDRASNDIEVRAERFVLAYWDTALRAAVKIAWAS